MAILPSFCPSYLSHWWTDASNNFAWRIYFLRRLIFGLKSVWSVLIPDEWLIEELYNTMDSTLFTISSALLFLNYSFLVEEGETSAHT